ncbi:MAG: YIP1 family protein [Bacillota bacterium]
MEENKSEKNGSLFGGIFGVIWSPSETLGRIVQKPDFLGAGGLFLLVSLLLTLPILSKLREAAALSLKNMPGVLSPSQVDMALNIAVITAVIASVLMPAIMWLVIAALLKLFNAFTGEKATFKALFAVTVFSYLPLMIESVIKTVMIMLSPAEKISGITISPALLLPPPGPIPGKFYVFLSQFDPFIIWSVLLTALGAAIAMKIPFFRTAFYLLGLWLLYVIGLTLVSGLGA